MILRALLLSAPFVLSASGCGSCTSEAPDKATGPDAPAPEGDAAADAGTTPAPPAPLTGTGLAVIEGDSATVWTDGRSGGFKAKLEAVSWSQDGFQVGLTAPYRIVGPGGAMRFRTQPLGDAKPLSELAATETRPPAGFKIDISTAPGGRSRLAVVAPADRGTRLGTYTEAPTSAVWVEGRLPQGGQTSEALGRGVAWVVGDNGAPKTALPEGGEALAAKPASADQLKAWTADVTTIAGAPVTVTWSALFDLDQDGTDEGALCHTGGKADYACHIVETDPTGAYDYYGVDFAVPGADAAPLGLRFQGGAYLIWAGQAVRTSGDSPAVLHVVRWSGSNYETDKVR